jgi:hypothetical protein
MINILVACDDWDVNLGEYLGDTFYKLCESCDLFNSKFHTDLVDTESYLNYTIDSKIKAFNSKPFLFLGLAHGNDDAIFIKDDELINEGNSNLFKDSFFYAISCCTAKILGDILIKEGCRTYIGYNDSVNIILLHQDIFRDCQTHGFERFIKDNLSSHDSFSQMIDKYNTEIDDLYPTDSVTAGYLLANREALEIKGDQNCLLSDFVI